MVAVQRAALQLPPRRAAKAVKMRTISRAEGGRTACACSAALWPKHRAWQQSPWLWWTHTEMCAPLWWAYAT